MANPQKENGHLDIANEIVEILARTHLSGNEMQIIWAVLRKTWSWQKKYDRIPLSQLEKMTKLSRVAVCRAKKSLVSKMILEEKDGGIGFNKDYDGWLVSKMTLVSKTAIGSVKNGNQLVSKMTPSKETYSKETYSKEKMEKNLGIFFTIIFQNNFLTKKQMELDYEPCDDGGNSLAEYRKQMARKKKSLIQQLIDQGKTVQDLLAVIANSKNRTAQIISMFWKHRGTEFADVYQLYEEFQRHSKPAAILKSYSDEKIKRTFGYLDRQEYLSDWTLETVIKKISRIEILDKSIKPLIIPKCKE